MMNVLRNPSFFRPASRPSSPAPVTQTIAPSRADTYPGPDRASRSLNKLSFSNFKRTSAPTSPVSSAPMPLVHDASYVEMLSLKLSEAVSKALVQPTGAAASTEQVSGKRPIPHGRGHALGALIASELKATQQSPYLRRALLRSLHRPLSVLLSNLSARLLPLLSSSEFLSPPAPTMQQPNPNPTQLHALGVAGLAGELLDTFDEFDLGLDADPRGDGLKLIREGLVSIVNRVVSPLVNGIRNELMPLLESLEVPTLNIRASQGSKAFVAYHPSILALQAIMPVYARALQRYTTSAVSQATLATFLISVVWRGLVALAHRPYFSATPPASPSQTSLKRSIGSTTPPATPPPSRFAIKLPPSRPPSPPPLVASATAVTDARALYELLNLLPRPTVDTQGTKLAQEAVDDAFEGLKALPPLLDIVLAFATQKGDHQLMAQQLESLTTAVPLLIALPVVLQMHAYSGSAPMSVAQALGLSEEDFRKECLIGFGRAEECATVVAGQVLQVLRVHPNTHAVVCRWLEMELADMGDF